MNWLGEILAKYIGIEDDVLDIGCGILQQFGGSPPPCKSYTAVDSYLPYLEHIKGRVTTVIHANYPYVELPQADIVLAIDFIEHLNYEHGRELLWQIKNLARRTGIIYTPAGFRTNDENMEAGGMGYNPKQAHLSGWETGTFEEWDFKVSHYYPKEGHSLLAVWTTE